MTDLKIKIETVDILVRDVDEYGRINTPARDEMTKISMVMLGESTGKVEEEKIESITHLMVNPAQVFERAVDDQGRTTVPKKYRGEEDVVVAVLAFSTE